MATGNNDDETYHDLVKQERIIAALNNELHELEAEEKHLKIELKDFQNKEEKVLETEEQHVARVKELNDLIQQKKAELSELEKQLIELKSQAEQLEDQLDPQQQKLENVRKELQENTSLMNKLEEQLECSEDKQSLLKDLREVLMHEKQEVERKVNDLHQQSEELKTQAQKLPQDIETLEGEMKLLEQRLKNAQEDVQSSADQIGNLGRLIQDNEEPMLNLQRQNIRSNTELIRINHLINRISLIIEFQQKNPKEFGQFKVNLQADLQQAEAQLVAIQNEITPLVQKKEEIEKLIRPLNERLIALAQELIEHKNKLRTLNETIEQERHVSVQRIAQREQDCNQLLEQKIDIDEELKRKEEEVKEIKDKIKDLGQEQTDLNAELEPITKQSATNPDQFATELNERKRTLQLELWEAKVKRTTAEEKSRKQEQVVQDARQHLYKCQQKEWQCYLVERRTEFEIETAKQNLALAQQSSDITATNFEALAAYIKANPKAKVVGQTAKSNVIETCRKAVEDSKVDLHKRQELLEKRTQDLNNAKTNAKQAGDALEAAENELRTCQTDVIVARDKVSLIEQKVSQQLSAVDDALKQNRDLQEKYREIEEQWHSKKTDIESIEQQQRIAEQKLNIAETNLNDLKKKQTNLIASIEQGQRDLRTHQQDYEKALVKHQTITDQMDENQIQQNVLKRDIRQKQMEIQDIQVQLNSKQQEESQIEGKVNNFQQLSKLISESNTDLQSELDQQQLQLDRTNRQILGSKGVLESLEKKREDFQSEMGQYQQARPQLKRNVQMRYQELIENKLKYGRSKHDLDQCKNELQSNQDEYHRYEERNSVLAGLLDANEREMNGNQAAIDETKRNIGRQVELEQSIKSVIEKEDKEHEEKKYAIKRLTNDISDLFKQYSDGIDQQNKLLTDLKSIQDLKPNIINKLIEYERELFKQRSKLNLLHHEIASKWNSIRNYKEKQSRYTLDLYSV